jgi:hypothetical protein
MAVYQLRLSNGLNLKSWIRHLALQLESQIPAHDWPAIYPNKGVRVLILAKALRQGALNRLKAFDVCGSQAQCDEACVPVERNHAQERYMESHGLVPVERYQVVCRGASDFARELVQQILWRVPGAASRSKALLRELTAEVSKHLFINELCGNTELCGLSMPKDLVAETTRDPGPVEIETAP